MNKIGINIKTIRKSCNMLQSELAKKLGVANTTVSSWEVGRTEPDLKMIESLSLVLNCHTTDIIGSPSNAFLLSDSEKELILKFRNADEIDQRSILRTLNLE